MNAPGLPLITVVVPNYNHGRFLEQRMQSILLQSFRDFQIIILDDASTDNSREIIERYRANPLVKAIVYNQENAGRPILQWLKGIELSDTEWIWIAESDDYCDERFLESLSPAFDKKDATLALADIVFVDEQGTTIKSFAATAEGFQGGPAFINERMLHNCFVCNSGMAVFRKKAAPVSGDWVSQFSFSPDYFFWTSVMQQGRVYTCGKSLSYFRKHDAEFTHGKLESVASQTDHAHLLELLSKKGLLEKEKLAQLVMDKLVTLYTRQKGMQRSLFDALTSIWYQLAIASGIPVNGVSVQAKAMLRKIKHRFKSLYAIQSGLKHNSLSG
jgi:hypothetical protein